VGEFSGINGLAGALAEHVPLVSIVGCPERADRKNRVPLHHLVGESKHGYDIPRKIAKRLTVAHSLLDDPATAPAKIDHILRACIRKSGPVYICIPQDIVDAECAVTASGSILAKPRAVDAKALAEAIAEATALLNAAKHPLIVVDAGSVRQADARAEVHRLIDASGLPFVTTPMSKSAIDESHKQFLGVYSGNRSKEAVRKVVDAADVVLQLGPVATDMNWGGFTSTVGQEGCAIVVDVNQTRVKNHVFLKVPLTAFLPALRNGISKRECALPVPAPASLGPFVAERDAQLVHNRFFDRLAHALPPRAIVVADIGVASFAATEVPLAAPGVTFMSQVCYASIGWSVGAAFGASVADPTRPVVLIVGDGALQMTVQELSSMVRRRSNVLVFVLNNDGYTIERLILDGSFNDINRWHYRDLLAVFGGNPGLKAVTEGELDDALIRVAAATAPGSVNGPQLVEIVMSRDDAPAALKSAALKMRK